MNKPNIEYLTLYKPNKFFNLTLLPNFILKNSDMIKKLPYHTLQIKVKLSFNNDEIILGKLMLKAKKQ